jgi:hypothetical protein
MKDSKLNGVFIIPTGISSSIGGHASALSQVNLIASCCNKLLANPNSVNASDINTMANNVWYVEGSTLDRMLNENINLKETKTYNKILCVVNSPLSIASINAVNAARWTSGCDITLVELNTALIMEAFIHPNGVADGNIYGMDELINQVKNLDFDILTVHTPIICSKEISDYYWINGGTSPWGAVEAKLSKYLSYALNKQAVHSPVEFLEDALFNKIIVDKQQAAEIISQTFGQCMWIGSRRAPTIDITKNNKNLSNDDIDFMVSPYNCWSTPHIACINNNIPIIVVKENTTCLKDVIYPDNKNIIFVENYLEAAGVVQCLNAGVDYKIVKEQ